jgi:hypothetical protein
VNIGISTTTAVLTFALVGATVVAAPAAAAAPRCVNTGPRTTQCETGGSTQIVTSPPETNHGWPYGGWGYGGLVIGIGI